MSAVAAEKSKNCRSCGCPTDAAKAALAATGYRTCGDQASIEPRTVVELTAADEVLHRLVEWEVAIWFVVKWPSWWCESMSGA